MQTFSTNKAYNVHKAQLSLKKYLDSDNDCNYDINYLSNNEDSNNTYNNKKCNKNKKNALYNLKNNVKNNYLTLKNNFVITNMLNKTCDIINSQNCKNINQNSNRLNEHNKNFNFYQSKTKIIKSKKTCPFVLKHDNDAILFENGMFIIKNSKIIMQFKINIVNVLQLFF